MKIFILIKNIILLIMCSIIFITYDITNNSMLKSIVLGNLILVTVSLFYLFFIMFLKKIKYVSFFKYIKITTLMFFLGLIFLGMLIENRNNELGVISLLFIFVDILFLLGCVAVNNKRLNYVFFNANSILKNRVITRLVSSYKMGNINNDYLSKRFNQTNIENHSISFNPASGLPMINNSIDIGGNACGSYNK